MTETFKNDVEKGLNATPKTLPSKYFYDKKGDALFVEIMNLPEYYLSRCELDIFQNKTKDLIDKLQLDPNSYFELIELGARDGSKTKELLRMIDAKKFKFDYFPIDISINSLKLLKQDLNEELPNVSVQTKQGDYFGVLASLKESKLPKIVLFLGSNIGNMSDEMAAQFIHNLSAILQAGDKLVLGVDLIKPKELVLPAYDDHEGITAKFNLNLLRRINDELGGNFDLNLFEHQAEYNEEEGIAKSFITSTVEQKVTIKAMGKSFEFAAAEKIHTEVSRKYNDAILAKIIANTDFRICNKIMDSKEYFADYILERS
ncbi:L-histidine N(alpha)-methyltransferase [Flavobacterium sp. W22_SRS_FP1]|uniref:L-histidine N(alpha)-methyltransferase n=1 Tax=Flavobacterium sp. W22_SRS_FP1 TaxID=3240276 RepID=UPI003F908233